MATSDVYTGDYMSVEERCADAINVGLFHGRRVVNPEQITEIDTVSNIVMKNKGKGEVIQPRRDMLKAVAYDTNFCIIGVENQTDVHYVFPVRAMFYDAVQYKKQWNKIKKKHKVRKDLKGAEYISGFSKKDKLRAVATLVVYFGLEPWDGAKDIHSLIDWTDIPEEFKEIVPNYSIYLLELNKYENPDDFQSDLKAICLFLKNANDDKKLEAMLKEHEKDFQELKEDAFDLIGVLGNMTQLKMVKDKCKEEDGGYNMCKGMEDWLNRREEEGVSKGVHGKLRELVEKKLKKGKSIAEIADALEEDEETIQELIDEINNDNTSDEIMEKEEA